MYYLLAGLFLPMINALLTVKIYQHSFYYHNSSCAFLRNTSLSNDASIQSCIWTCQDEYGCQTAVYYNDNKTCSMFSEVCTTGRIESSGSTVASVICHGKNHQPVTTCSSTLTTVVDVTTSTMEMSASITTAVTPYTSPQTQAFWSFDSNFDDLYNTYNGEAKNNASFFSPGYPGYGSALSLNESQSQYVLVTKFLNMTYTSFTWELWAYPKTLSNYDSVMVAMCASPSTDKCLQLLIRNRTTYFGFYNDDCSDSTIVNTNEWYHFAFVYNYTNGTQYIYLNGELECTHKSTKPFQGNSDNITIGAIGWSGASQTLVSYWTGYIDQLSYVSRGKTEIEILTDATLAAYYSFDNGSFYDSGPNKINGTGVNISSVAGRINQGILFNASEAYFQADGFTLLGVSNRSYSIALWIYRLSPTVGNGTIVHLSANALGAFAWCIPIIGLTSSGQIAAQSYNGSVVGITGPTLPLANWTHVVTSYSATNGIRLWVNGSLFNASGAFTYKASGVPDTVTLGSSLYYGPSSCETGPIQEGQFFGMMDELRVYSRELNACDVYALANT